MRTVTIKMMYLYTLIYREDDGTISEYKGEIEPRVKDCTLLDATECLIKDASNDFGLNGKLIKLTVEEK